MPLQNYVDSTRKVAFGLLMVAFYLSIIAYAGLSITMLQIRQQIGPHFDTVFELINAERKLPGAFVIERATIAGEDRSTISNIAVDQKTTTAEVTLLDKRLKDLEKDEAKITELKARVSAISDFLNSAPVGWMAKMPADFVVLFLATMMGALGGALSTVRKLLVEEEENPRLVDYALRPALGFIVAIAVFTLFKAGQLVISNNAATQSTDALNPFLVAFIGVISGLVAKHAITSIEVAGTSFFSSREEERPVYAREQFVKEIKSLSPTESNLLVSTLNIDEGELAAWLTERRPIPKRESRIISAFLRVSTRDLFSGEPKP
jgi:hypothetical protein